MKLQSFFVALFLLFAWLIPAHAEDSSGQRVILVLDASGSMRAKINGRMKIDIAKDVVGQIVAGWNPQDELGLVVYGHRKKGECTDIETVKEPGPLNADDYMAAVNAIQPKGQTPMTEAVKQAAEALSYTEKKATVILVSDGIETCNADPCAVADELAKTGVELKVHTVGFGLDDKGAVAQLKCLADKTGGTFTIANNADDLLKALQKTVEAKPAPPPPAPAPADPLNLTAHAIMADGVEIPSGTHIKWEIRKPNNADGSQGETVNYAYIDTWKVHIDPGTYVLRVDAGDTFLEQPLTIADAQPVKANPVLNAGIVNFSATMDDSKKLTDNGAFWEVQTPDGKSVAYAYAADHGFMVAAGSYLIHLSLGEADIKVPFEVKAGDIRDQVISFGAGKLIAQATFSQGGDAVENGVSFEVHKPDQADGQKGESITTLYDPKSTFTLPAGPYIVHVGVGIAGAEQPIEIKAGQMVNLTINANAGYIAGKADGGAARWVINAGKVSLDGQRKSLSTTYDPTLNLAVNAGTYQVQAFKSDDTPLGEKTIEVKAGERTEVTFP